MIQEIFLYESPSFDPYYNLAMEQYLLETVREGQCVLYLWQNEHTVVIGRNQNPWKECKTTLLYEEGGHLARRLSGGGAVYHDLGNLNFTFLMPQTDYDLDQQLAVIQAAVEAFGIKTQRSGRNDVLAEGRKFSGNAFYKNGKQAYHHGTLLVDVDKEKLGRYLSPSKAKLQAKGVDSVRSRVVNLRELNAEITIDGMKQGLKTAFSRVWSLPLQRLDLADPDQVEKISQRNRSWEWNFGQKLPFTYSSEDRFPWGSIEVMVQVERGVIHQIKVYSDAMDWSVAPQLEQALLKCRFEKTAIEERLVRFSEAEDIFSLFQAIL